MTDTTKIRLIKAYIELLTLVADKGQELKNNLEWNNGLSIGYEEVREVINHLGNEIKNIKI